MCGTGLEGLKPAQDPEFDPQGLEVSLKGFFKQGSDLRVAHVAGRLLG